jgi:hypothetical protein
MCSYPPIQQCNAEHDAEAIGSATPRLICRLAISMFVDKPGYVIGHTKATSYPAITSLVGPATGRDGAANYREAATSESRRATMRVMSTFVLGPKPNESAPDTAPSAM